MNVQSLLDQLLSSGQSIVSGTSGNPAQPAAPGTSKYANFGTGMLAGGVLGLLLGDKRVRKFGGKALWLWRRSGPRRAGIPCLQQLAAAKVGARFCLGRRAPGRAIPAGSGR